MRSISAAAACMFALLVVLSAVFVAADCSDSVPTIIGGGGPGPGSSPTPTPHTWLLLPGCCDFFAYQEETGTSDHHDGGNGSHAVDIDINGAYCDDVTHVCTPNCGGVCPDVFYYDKSHSVAPTGTRKFDASCASGFGGGQKEEFDIYALDPLGKFVGTVKYLHLTNAVAGGSEVYDGSRLGTVNPLAGWDCWTGPHLHQQITPYAQSGLVHLTGNGSNCPSNGTASSSVPCYSISW